MLIPFYNIHLDKETGRARLKRVRNKIVELDIDYLDTAWKVHKFTEEVLQLSEKGEEYVYLYAINTKCKLLGVFLISKGTISAALIGVREIFVRVLLIGASGFLLVHNHPSQDVTPSQDDILTTKRVKEVGELVGVKLTDHIITSKTKFYSMRENEII